MFVERLEDRALLSGEAGEDDFAGDFDQAAPLVLAADGSGTRAGSIDVVGDVDTFQFVAPVTGGLAIRLVASPGSDLGPLDASAIIYDAARQSLGEVSLGERPFGLHVTAGRTYFVQASSRPGLPVRTGEYVLSVAPVPDDFDDGFDRAAPIPLSDDGSGSQAGSFETMGDVDTFRFVAPVTGRLAVRLDAGPGSDLYSGQVIAFDEGRESLGRSDLGRGPFGLLVMAGRTYYVQALGSSPSRDAGGYVLSVAPVRDDFGDDFEDAAPLVLAADGSVSQAASIDVIGDIDTFRFVAPVTGRFTAALTTTEVDELLPLLSVFDGDRNPLAVPEERDPDTPFGQAMFDVIGGRTYYLRAEGWSDDGDRSYTLGLSLRFTALASREREPNDDRGAAAFIIAGTATAGAIDPGDVDHFALLPLRGGRFTARVHAEGVRTRLSLLDEQGRLLVQSDGIAPDDRANRIDQHLPPGTFYLRVEGLGGTGDYLLETDLAEATAPFRELAVDRSPRAIGSGDFNGDGIPDLAVTGSSGTVTVLLGRGDGTFRRQRPVVVGDYPVSLLVSDLDGDGRPDLATANLFSGDVSVLLGRGDGSFQEQRRFAVGHLPSSLVVTDVDGDGRPDLAAAHLVGIDPDTGQYSSSGIVSVLLGRGDGSFQAPRRHPVGDHPLSLVAADLDGDSLPDLATANAGSGDVAVLLGRGDGTFQEQRRFAAGDAPQYLVVSDVDGDGRPDLVAANAGGSDPITGQFSPGDVAVLLGRGDGTFQEPRRLTAGSDPRCLVAADLDGDGRLDLATANASSGDVSVLLGRGDGTFREQRRSAAGNGPVSLVMADLDGDGRPDLATANGSGDVSVLMGRGDGTFQEQRRRLAAGDGPVSLVVSDLDGDGRPDLATANLFSGDVSVLLGRGDGTFQEQRRFAVGAYPASLMVVDLNGDGRPDLVTVNRHSDDVSVLLGRGDGTFQEQRRFAAGDFPLSLVVSDVDGDGRPDLVTPNAGSGDVAVLLGRGDGTFQGPRRFAAGNRPASLVVSDLDGDGHLDLATANAGGFDSITGQFTPGDVAVLLGRGDGTFREPRRSAEGHHPSALEMSDVDGDNRPDLVIVDAGGFDPMTEENVAGDVAVLLGRGDGTFHEPHRLAVGGDPATLPVSADLDGDGRPDLAVINAASDGDVLVLLGRGDGTFREPRRFAVGWFQYSLLVSDLDGDGRPDLATANRYSYDVFDVAVLLGHGDGTFQEPRRRTVGGPPGSLVVSDFNGDGRTDLANTHGRSDDVSVGLNLGGGTFAGPGPFVTASHATPLLADLEQDGADDVLVLNQAGEILWRKGRTQEPGTFEPPLIVNPGVPARDLAAIDSDQGPLIASVDAQANSVSLYAHRDGPFLRIGSLPTGLLPAQVAPADLDGDGRTDLVVRNAGDGTASVYLDDGSGHFRKRLDDLPIGLGASDLRLADVDQTGTIDLIVTNQSSGEVRLLFNRGDATFTRESRYYGGNGLYGLVDDAGTPALESREETAGVAVGTFVLRDGPGTPTDDPLPVLDLVTINPGSNTLGVLAGLGGGAFANPRRIITPQPARVIRTEDFNGDGVTDVALLEASRVTTFLGDGRGGFAAPLTIDAGPNPTGLSVADADHDGQLDLLVGNDFGDVLVLPGHGDGTFEPYHKVDRGVALAVADLDGDGRDDFVFANQALDRVVVTFGDAGTTVVDDRSRGLLAPGAVALTDLDQDGDQDLAVANSGSNNVLVYPGLGDGRFGSAVNGGRGFFVGTNPVAIVVTDLNVDETNRGDGIPDLVVTNRGSNDVSVLLGRGRGDDWTLLPGTRFGAGFGPVATLVQEVDGDGKPDLLVSNSLSDDVRLIPGVGLGNFAEDRAVIIPVGHTPGPVFVGDFDARPGLDLVTLNRGSDDLTLVSDFLGDAGSSRSRSIVSGGLGPVAGFVGDFNRDGILDLTVAHNGDGHLALLLGGDTGPGLAQVLTSPALPRPTALVFDSVGDGLVRFYASTEGLEAAFFLTFTLGVRGGGDGGIPPASSSGPDPGIGSGPPPFLSPGPGPDDDFAPPPFVFPGPGPGLDAPDTTVPDATEEVAQLHPLRESALALVAALLTVALNLDGTTTEADAANEPAGAAALGTFAGRVTAALAQGATQTEDPVGAPGEADDAEGPPDDEQEVPPPEVVPEWIRFVADLDDVFDRYLRESPADLPPGAGLPSLAARLLAALDVVQDRLAQSSGAGRPGMVGRLRRAVEPTVEAIDAAIDLLWSEEVPSSASALGPPRRAVPGDANPEHQGHAVRVEVAALTVSLVLITTLLARHAWPSLRRRRARRRAFVARHR